MAYNIPERYSDLTPAPQLDKKTLNKMVWMSCFLQASFNYERMQACGWLWGILPGLKKIHTNKEDLKASMAHNLDFLNTHPFLVTFVMGIVLSLEQNKAETATIRSVRISAAGPLGGIGDALFWLTLVPITAGLTANIAMEGNILGAVLFLIIFNAVQFVVRWWLMHWSYNLGTKAVTMLTSNAKEFTRAASILGIFVVGGLIANYGATSLRITVGSPTINIQSLIDGILPKLIPLLITLGIYTLIKKGWTPVKCILLILVTGIVGCAFVSGLVIPKLWITMETQSQVDTTRWLNGTLTMAVKKNLLLKSRNTQLRKSLSSCRIWVSRLMLLQTLLVT